MIRPHTFAVLLCCSLASLIGNACATTAPSPVKERFAPDALVEPALNLATMTAQTERELVEKQNLTLDEVLAFADLHAPAIALAKAKVGIEQAKIAEAKIALPDNPTLDFSAGGKTVDGQTGFIFEIMVAQQLGIAGEASQRQQAAEAQALVARAVVNEMRWTVHVEIHRLFRNIHISHQQIRNARRFVSLIEQLQKWTDIQIQQGDLSPMAKLVLEVNLARTQEALLSAQQREVALHSKIATIAGWPKTKMPEIIAGEDPTFPDLKYSLDALMALMVKNHPSFRKHELAVLAADSQRSASERLAWPKPTIGFRYGHEDPPIATEKATETWLFSLSLPIPLWHRNIGQRQQAQAELEVADIERSQNISRRKLALHDAYYQLESSIQRARSFEKNILKTLDQKLALMQKSYQLGEVNIHQIAQLEAQIFDATAQYFDVLVDCNDAAATLESLVGVELWGSELKSEP